MDEPLGAAPSWSDVSNQQDRRAASGFERRRGFRAAGFGDHGEADDADLAIADLRISDCGLIGDCGSRIADLI
jgi:hypothetical protein